MSYQPRRHYSEMELLRAEIADFEADIRCARRDITDLTAYAAKCQEELERKTIRLGELMTEEGR